ncbi:MAG: hypothetical protein ACP5E5_14990 [Acidobacteriaceae bacterium]
MSVRRDPQSGDLILTEVPSLDDVFAALDAAKLPEDFMSDLDCDPRLTENRPALDHLFQAAMGAEEQR